MIGRVKNTTLLLSVIAIGVVSSPVFAQTSSERVLRGKNVTVYLEDAEFGIQAEKFAYSPSARSVDIQAEKPKIAPKIPGVIATARFVSASSAQVQPAQPTQPKKISPCPEGTNFAPKPLLAKPQPQPAVRELSFDLLSQVSSL